VRTTVRTLAGFGCVAALLLAGPVRGQSMGGGTGSFSAGSSSGGSSGGSSSGSSGSSASNSNFSIDGQSLQTSIGQTPSALNSFNNVGTGAVSGSGAVSASNPLAGYYVNPLAQGYITISSSGTPSPSNAAFGNPLYGNLSSGSGSGSLGGRSTGSAFGGSSSSSRGSFGGSTSGGGSSSLNGTATIGRGTSGTAILFTGGGSYGPANGRRGPVLGFTMRGGVRPIPMAARRVELQEMITRSSAITAPAGIIVTTDGNAIVLTGTVASEDERRIAENVLRTSPGVFAVKNNLTVGPPPGPGPTSPAPGGIPGPNPIAPAPGTSTARTGP
jgi:hypothetical protein